MTSLIRYLIGLAAFACVSVILLGAPVVHAESNDTTVKKILLRSGVHVQDVTFLANRTTTRATIAVTGAKTLDSDDCGAILYVTAGIDTASITLPSTIDGCEYRVMYTGADGGALLDISPAAADAIHGSCTLAASVLEFSGTDDADIGLTKNTVNTGDTITLMGDGSAGWFVQTCTGIWANN